MEHEKRLDLIDRAKVYENTCAGCTRHGEKPGECYHDEPCERLMEWKENGNKPKLYIFENGGRKKNGDICFDISLIVGYTVFNYTNWDLQGLRGD